METLEQFIVRETNFTHGELRRAMFAHPNVGVIEAVRRCMGAAKGAELLTLVSQKLAIPELDAGGITVDEHIIEKGGEALQRLIYAFRAVPLNFYGKEDKKKIRLAMTDPVNRYARSVFQSFFGMQVMPCSVPEAELFQALDEAFTACSPNADFRKKFADRTVVQPDIESTPEIEKAIRWMFTEAIEHAAKEIELEFRDTFTKAVIGLPLDMTKTIDLPVVPEELAAALVARSDLQQSQRAVFEGTAHLTIKDAAIDAQIEFHQFHKNRAGVEGRALILSQISVNAANRASFWFSQPPTAIQAFDKALSASPGLFVCGCPDDFLRDSLAAAVKRRYPDLYVVPDLQSLATDPTLPAKVQQNRVLLTLRAGGLLAVLKQLDPVPPNVRTLIRSVLSYSRLPRICYYCSEDTKPTPESLELFPASYRQHVQLLKYPRGCAVCQKEGYTGSIGLTSVLPIESEAGRAFAEGKNSSDIATLLRSSGVRSIVETGLDTVLSGATTIEMFSKALLGKTDIAAHHFSTIGRQIVRDGKVVATGSERSDKSPLDSSKPKSGSSMADFHSVVLQLDDDFMSMRDQLMSEDGEDDSEEAW